MKVRREIPKFNKDGSRSKKDAVQYCCSPCGQWTKSTAVAVDHISPVIDVQDGFVDWNEFISRLFCDASNLQVICDTCHNAKTQGERIARLTKQYTEELNNLEELCKDPADPKFLKKQLSKYTAKKKTPGLQKIVERALRLKQQLK
jgi:5-methylcytosine-specific restriction endonuclease McrA